VVVAPDPDGGVAAALAGAPVTLISPGPGTPGPLGQILRGIGAAFAEVTDTDGVIVWPAEFQWLDAETVTSLIEAHGQEPGRLLRPTYEGDPGWPALLPRPVAERLGELRADLPLDDLMSAALGAGATEWRIDLGDPGSIHDDSVARADLPPYLGPAGPASGHHEWGAAVGDTAGDADMTNAPAMDPEPIGSDR